MLRSRSFWTWQITSMEIWATICACWLLCCAMLAGSHYLELQLGDAVGLQQHARDLVSAGLDPLSASAGGAVTIGAFTVPPARILAPFFWVGYGSYYTHLTLSLPLALFLALQAGCALRWILRPAIRAQRPAHPVSGRIQLAANRMAANRIGVRDPC